MKSHNIIFLLLGFILTSCFPSGLILDSAFDYQGKFQTYKTFAFLNDSQTHKLSLEEELIRNTTYGRFMALGYKYHPEKPDIYVTYKFFQEPVALKGFRQGNLEDWLLRFSTMDYQDIASEHKIYHEKQVFLPAGSCSIFIIDAENSKMIWRGFTGQIGPWEHERQLKASVARVLDGYKVIAYN